MIPGKNKITGLLLSLILLLATVTACTSHNNNNGTILSDGDNKQEETFASNLGEAERQYLDLPVYYSKSTDAGEFLVREVHQVPFTNDSVNAALEELISGNPITQGAVRILPEGTKIRSVHIQDGLATVDFSRDVLQANIGGQTEELGIQSIVNTLTEFPDINKVSFQVEGGVDEQAMKWWGHVGLYEQPFQRDLSQVNEPVIWVDSPVSGQTISSPIEIRGNARVFEGTVRARILDSSGKELSNGFALTEHDTSKLGEFIMRLDFQTDSTDEGKVEVYWESPKDGEELDRVIIPILLS